MVGMAVFWLYLCVVSYQRFCDVGQKEGGNRMKLRQALKDFREQERNSQEIADIVYEAEKEIVGRPWKGILLAGLLMVLSFFQSDVVLMGIMVMVFLGLLFPGFDEWSKEQSDEAKRKLNFLKRKGLIK